MKSRVEAASITPAHRADRVLWSAPAARPCRTRPCRMVAVRRPQGGYDAVAAGNARRQEGLNRRPDFVEPAAQPLLGGLGRIDRAVADHENQRHHEALAVAATAFEQAGRPRSSNGKQTGCRSGSAGWALSDSSSSCAVSAPLFST